MGLSCNVGFAWRLNVKIFAVVTCVAIALLLLPGSASAHGLVGRADLPIPEWLFAWAAIVVLLVSFVVLAFAWKSPRLAGSGWRPLPAFLSDLITNPVTEALAGLIGVTLLVLTLWSGFAGSQVPTKNFGPTFIYVIFWVGLVPASILFGDVFKAFNPWRAVARAVAGVAKLVSRSPLPAPMAYPKKLGRWPAVAVLFGFVWIELAFSGRDDPSSLATAVAVYSAITWLAMSVYGVDTWIKRGEGFSVYFNLFSRISIWERRDDRIGVRPPLAGLARMAYVPGTVPLLALLIGSVSFDGASEGPLWTDVGTWLADRVQSIGLGGDEPVTISFTLGLIAAVLIVYGFYRLGIWGVRSVGGELSTKELAGRFVHSLVPIAAAYSIAHYASFLAYQGQAMAWLISDPLGDGSDIFGTASVTINYGILSATAVWYIQVGVLVTGHVCGLILAHDKALELYRESHVATRSQYWMLVIMVGFTTLGLWLLSQANA